MARRGLFVVFEGADGSGKSTALAAVAEGLRQAHQTVTTTREPGGTPIAEKIRDLCLSEGLSEAGAWTQLMLMTAARLDHASALIEPRLEAGEIVLCDRYIDSTMVYQGRLGGLNLSKIEALYAQLPLPQPDLRLFLELDAQTAWSRLQARTDNNHMDASSQVRWQQVATAYAKQFAAQPAKLVRIDAAASPEQVASACLTAILSHV
nr:dTMP kinase [Oceanococcus sp. HetDA_MAG_MS8]